MKRIWIAVVVILLGVGAFFGYQSYQQAQAASSAQQYQTARIERGTLTATVGGTGTVRANQSTVLMWQTSGTVEQVNALLDQPVKNGDVLATLMESSLPQNIILAQAELVVAQRDLENLLNSETARAQAELALVTAQDAFEDAERRRNNLDRGRASQETIDSAEAGYILAQQEVDRLQGIYNNSLHLPEDDPARALALANLANAKKARDKALANVNWYKGSASEKEFSEADANLAVAEAQLADAQREYDRLKNGPDPDDIAAAEARIAAIQATLNLAQLTAPFAGTITEINIKPGDQVAPAGAAFRIDDLSRLLVDVPISEVDINRIQIGQDVTMTFDAILDQEYHGQVVEVARVGIPANGVVNFTVTVELTDADEQVRPGMTAAVNIVSTQLDDVLLVPNRAVRMREGERVVYVLRNTQPEPVIIRLGATSDTNSQVLEGELQVGDEIILNPPTEFSGNGPFMGRR